MKPPRWKNLVALMLIGDGALTLLRPQRDSGRWSLSPKSWKAARRHLSGHPNAVRAAGAVQMAVGVAMIVHNRTAVKQRKLEAEAVRARVRAIA